MEELSNSDSESKEEQNDELGITPEEVSDKLITKLIKSRISNQISNIEITTIECTIIIQKATELLSKEAVLLELEGPLIICGDIHGQFYDLLRIFEVLELPPKKKFLFLGDYVDRGKQSLECILLLLALKIKYPSNIYLLRGNHETPDMNKIYGFYDECKRRVNLKIYKQFENLFNNLPLTALISEKILCMHGGISDKFTSEDDIEELKNIKKPDSIPDEGLSCDIVWSDPNPEAESKFTENERGISICFSQEALKEFCEKNDIDLICRAHQVVEEGFEFFCDMKLVTIFSAPNYCGEIDNKGAIMTVDEDLRCGFQILNPIIQGKAKGKKKFSRYFQ